MNFYFYFRSIRCPEIENIDDSEDSNYIKALIYRIAKFDDQKCIDYLVDNDVFVQFA